MAGKRERKPPKAVGLGHRLRDVHLQRARFMGGLFATPDSGHGAHGGQAKFSLGMFVMIGQNRQKAFVLGFADGPQRREPEQRVGMPHQLE